MSKLLLNSLARNIWVHFHLSPVGEMRMFLLKARYYGPFFFCCDAFCALAHRYFFSVSRFVYILICCFKFLVITLHKFTTIKRYRQRHKHLDAHHSVGMSRHIVRLRMSKRKQDKKCWNSGTVTNNFDYLTYGMFLYGIYTSLTFHNIPADTHIPTSTPTVRGHAEACPSTTYAIFLYLHPIALAARWRLFYNN